MTPPPLMTQQFAGVQILRFAAALLVAVMHITQAISIHVTGLGAAHYWAPGGAGVDIFFVISGFVMAASTRASAMLHGPARLHAAWVFVKRRILRIVPLYWFYTMLKAALILALPALAMKSTLAPEHLASSLLFIPAMSPWGLVQPVLPVGWTLNFEMLFYAVFAVAIALGAPRIRFCLLVFLSLLLTGQYVTQSVPLAFYAHSIIFEFILGVCIAHILAHYRRPAAVVGAGAALGGAVFIFGFGQGHLTAGLVPWGLGAAAIVLGTVWLEPLMARARLAKPLSFLGDTSYSIYLSHTFVVPAGVLLLARLGLRDSAAILPIVSACVIAAGCLSHLWIEQPMISFFKRFLFKAPPLQYRNAGNTPAD